MPRANAPAPAYTTTVAKSSLDVPHAAGGGAVVGTVIMLSPAVSSWMILPQKKIMKAGAHAGGLDGIRSGSPVISDDSRILLQVRRITHGRNDDDDNIVLVRAENASSRCTPFVLLSAIGRLVTTTP